MKPIFKKMKDVARSILGTCSVVFPLAVADAAKSQAAAAEVGCDYYKDGRIVGTLSTRAGTTRLEYHPKNSRFVELFDITSPSGITQIHAEINQGVVLNVDGESWFGSYIDYRRSTDRKVLRAARNVKLVCGF